MFGDLFPIPLAKIWWLARRALLLGCIVLVVGYTTSGNGNTLEKVPSSDKHVATPAPVELMHDAPVAASDEAHPSLAMPEIVTEIHKPRVIMMEVTAYCACPKCCGPNARGITASGKLINYNGGKFVAADTTVLPFGTKLMIPGYDGTPVEVIDRGGAIKGNKLDVFFPTHEAARKWGRQHVAVTIVD
jgi:3D (Asp-Asp-Asp) domain-containing protein